MVIFTTAYTNYALEGFELDAIDYLVKPIDPELFAKAVQKAADYFRVKNAAPSTAQSLFVRSEYRLVKIDFANILYIESLEDYLKIHTTAGKPVMTLMTMKAVLEKLPAATFARIHRSYIVPLARIKSVVSRKVDIGGIELPVSSSYTDFIKNWSGR